MQREEGIQLLVSQWLDLTDKDRRMAELAHLHDPELSFGIAFHAQQAVDKYLKAYLTKHQIPFAKTHDIKALLTALSTVDEEIAVSLDDAKELSVYAVDTRYPGDRNETTLDGARRALELMRIVRAQICPVLQDGH